MDDFKLDIDLKVLVEEFDNANYCLNKTTKIVNNEFGLLAYYNTINGLKKDNTIELKRQVALVSMLNAICTQKRYVFILSRQTLRSLLKKDKNFIKNWGFDNTTEFSSILAFLTKDNKYIKLIKAGEKGKTAGIYEVTCPKILHYLDGKKIDKAGQYKRLNLPFQTTVQTSTQTTVQTLNSNNNYNNEQLIGNNELLINNSNNNIKRLKEWFSTPLKSHSKFYYKLELGINKPNVAQLGAETPTKPKIDFNKVNIEFLIRRIDSILNNESLDRWGKIQQISNINKIKIHWPKVINHLKAYGYFLDNSDDILLEPEPPIKANVTFRKNVIIQKE